MPILGEHILVGWAYTTGNEPYTHSWEVTMPPSFASVRTFISEYWELAALSAQLSYARGALAYISSIRHRLEDDSDETVDFPDPYDSHDAIQAYSHRRLTSVTHAIKVKQSHCKVMTVINYWGPIEEGPIEDD